MSDSLVKLPNPLYSAAQVRQLDSLAIDKFGCSGSGLMQLAAKAAFQCILTRWPKTQFLRIFVGCGNNAGDGFLCAVLAKEHAIPCEIIIVGDLSRLGPDAGSAYQKAKLKRPSRSLGNIWSVLCKQNSKNLLEMGVVSCKLVYDIAKQTLDNT